MSISRTHFKRDIITEFVPPKNLKSGKVMIFCAGVPGVPSKDEVLEFFAKRGYWTFFPRYRGSWESHGAFLKLSPEQDVLDVISALAKPFKDFWSGESYQIKAKQITLVGTSFGGPAAILASRDARVHKAICISPVVDWVEENKNDPLEHLYTILSKGYGEAYRVSKKDWNKLKRGRFYNPVYHLDELDPRKIMIFHAKNDKVVRFFSVNRFAKKLKCATSFTKTGGHLSTSLLMKPSNYRKIKTFLRT